MEPSDFAPRERQHLIRVPTGYWAFVPPPLPPVLRFDTDLIAHLSDADRAVGGLRGISSWLSEPGLVISSMIRREAVLSSRIDGTVASVTDLAMLEAAPHGTGASAVREVANYEAALREAVPADRDLPIGLDLVRRLHAMVFDGAAEGSVAPGEFRSSQAWIGPPGCGLDDARFVPPPPSEMLECLTAFGDYLLEESSLPPLVRMAIAHQQFHAIYPFADGNGRIGRLLTTSLLREWDVLPLPLLHLSAFFEAHRAEYAARLLAVNLRGEWEEWVEFFLEGVAEQARDVAARARRLFDLRASYRERLGASGESAASARLVNGLFERPALTAAQACELMEVSSSEGTAVIERLVSAGVLRPAAGPAEAPVFVAHELLGLLDEPARGLAA